MDAMERGDTALLTPHGEREPLTDAEQGQKQKLLTPHGEREPGRLVAHSTAAVVS